MLNSKFGDFLTFISKRYKVIAIVYGSLLLLVILCLPLLSGYSKPFLDERFGEGFYQSLLASFIEDFIFFGTIGIAALIISARKLEDEDFSTRVRSLVNSNSVGNSAKKYIENQVKKLLAYNQSAVVRIIIEDYNESPCAFKILTINEVLINNMCKDINYPIITSAGVVEPGLSVNGDKGYVSYFGIRDINDESNQEILVEDKIVSLNSIKGRFERTVERFIITEDSAAKWKMSFCIWNQVAEPDSVSDYYYNIVERYTENYEVILVNNCTKLDSIKVDFTFPDNSQSDIKRSKTITRVVDQGVTTTLVNGIELHKRDKFYLYIHKPENYDKDI